MGGFESDDFLVRGTGVLCDVKSGAGGNTVGTSGLIEFV